MTDYTPIKHETDDQQMHRTIDDIAAVAMAVIACGLLAFGDILFALGYAVRGWLS